MNWRIIFLLSLFGLFMGIGTVYFIPAKIEPICWLVIFIISARVIAQQAEGRYFAHGFMVSIFNCIWIMIAHIWLSAAYIAHHSDESKQYLKMSAKWGLSLVQSMMIMEPIAGILSGLVLGTFAFIASRFISTHE